MRSPSLLASLVLALSTFDSTSALISLQPSSEPHGGVTDDSKMVADSTKKRASRHLALHRARNAAGHIVSDHFFPRSPSAAVLHELRAVATTSPASHSKAATQSFDSPNGTMLVVSTSSPEVTSAPSAVGLVQMFDTETNAVHIVTVIIPEDNIAALTTAAPTALGSPGIASTDQGSEELGSASHEHQEKPSDDAWKAAVIIVCALTTLTVVAFFIFTFWKKRQAHKKAAARRANIPSDREVARPRVRTTSYANRPLTPFPPSRSDAGPTRTVGIDNPTRASGQTLSFWSPQRNHPSSQIIADFPPPSSTPRSLSTHGRPTPEPLGAARATGDVNYGYALTTGHGYPITQTQSTIVVSEDEAEQGSLCRLRQEKSSGISFANEGNTATTAAPAPSASLAEEESYFPYNDQGFYVSPVQSRFIPPPVVGQQFSHHAPQASTNTVATYTTAPVINSLAATSGEQESSLKRRSVDDDGASAPATGAKPFVFQGGVDAGANEAKTEDQPPAKKPRLTDDEDATSETRPNGRVDDGENNSPRKLSHHGFVRAEVINTTAALGPTPCRGCLIPDSHAPPRTHVVPFDSVGSAGRGTPVHDRARPATATGDSMPATLVSRPGTPAPHSRVCSF